MLTKNHIYTPHIHAYASSTTCIFIQLSVSKRKNLRYTLINSCTSCATFNGTLTITHLALILSNLLTQSTYQHHHHSNRFSRPCYWAEQHKSYNTSTEESNYRTKQLQRRRRHTWWVESCTAALASSTIDWPANDISHKTAKCERSWR